jgi:hypothetical protein
MSIPENVLNLYGGPVPEPPSKGIPILLIMLLVGALIGGYVLFIRKSEEPTS